MKIQTINQLISVFKDIATRHYQINGFGIGDSWEIGADKAYMHPVLWINPTTANMPSTDTGYKTFEIDFDVRVFDLVHKGESNENEVLSDTIDILKDIITEFKGHPYYVNSQLNITGDISFESFTEEFDEEVSGWLCEISLMTPILTSFCGIPAADITGFEFPGVDCPDVNVLCPVFIDEILGDSPIIVTTAGTTRTISIDTSSLPDTFLTSSILNGTDLELTRNDGVTITTDLSSLAGGSVTADNGLNVLSNVVELGGTLNKSTTISGAYNPFTVGTLASKLTGYNIVSIEGNQKYTDSGYKLEVTDNPGGRVVELTTPTTTNSYQVNPAGFKLDIDTTYNSDFELYEYLTIDSGNFEIDRYDGLITFDDDLGNNELNTLTFDSNLNSQVLGDGVDESSFITSKSSLELKKTNAGAFLKESYYVIDDAKMKMYKKDTAVSEEGFFQIYGDFIEYKHTNSNGNEGQMFLGSNNFQMNYTTPGNAFGGSITIWPDKVTINSNSYGFFSVGPDTYFQDFRTVTKGIEYLADYSAGYTNRTLVDKEYVDTSISSIPTFTADYCRGSKTIGSTPAAYVSSDQTIPITVESENSDSSKFTVVSNGVKVNQDGRYRVNCATSIFSNSTMRANPIMSIAINGVIATDANGDNYNTVEHYARNAGSAQNSSSQLDLIFDLNQDDIVTIVMSVGGINAQSGVQILSEGTFLEVCEVVATQNTSGFSGTFTNGDGDTVTVSNGIITNIV